MSKEKFPKNPLMYKLSGYERELEFPDVTKKITNKKRWSRILTPKVDDIFTQQQQNGFPIGPVLAGWVETLSLPPDIIAEVCAMCKHPRNRIVCSENGEDPGQEAMRHFVALIQYMYKVKMENGSLEGLKTLIPVFLLLANKIRKE